MNQESLHQFAERLRDWTARKAHRPPPPEAEFNEWAQQLWSCQVKLNPVYQAWCRAAGPTRNPPPHWRDFPALPTQAFKELPVSCLPEPERTHEFQSSGTTGYRPSRHFHHANSLALYEHSACLAFSQRVSTERDQVILSLTPPLQEAPHSSLVHMFDRLIHVFGAPSSDFFGRTTAEGWVLETTRLRERLQTAEEPLLLLGTAFNFVHLLDSLTPQQPDLLLPAGSQIMETGGYKGRSRELSREELHRQLASRLGIPTAAILTEYGMSELSSQAYTTPPEANSHPTLQFPAWARALVVSPETGREVAEGEAGLLRVIDLANVWSVLAIQTADLAIRRGTHFELIGRAPAAEARGCSLMSTSPL